MTLISIEWGEDGRVRWADATGVYTLRTLQALSERLPAGTVALCEPSFYFCDNAEQRFLASELARYEHRLVPATRAGRELLETLAGPIPARSRVGWLRAISVGGAARLDHTVLGAHEFGAVRAALDIAHAVALGGVTLPALAGARESLGPYEGLDEPTRLALGDGADYDPELFAAIAVVAAASPSRRDFDRLLGLHEGPARGSIRSAPRRWYATQNGAPERFEHESHLTWSALRRATRLAYTRIAAARRRPQARAA